MFPRNQQRKTTPKFRAHIPYKTFHFFFCDESRKKNQQGLDAGPQIPEAGTRASMWGG